ncbi:dual specificity protein phosphatase family protein [Halorubrum halophilum]|uniref:dual specificity protein phosphatase family protein n=1 Tax=Halorubrum halophilum TaxID=413816 RepID=UPI0009E5576A|nr:dual specificity protein phosphatase family protein [Halorubrum halophilum]
MRNVDKEERLYVGRYNDIEAIELQKNDTLVNLSTTCSTAYTEPHSNIHIPLRDDPSCRYTDFQTAAKETVTRYRQGDTVAVVCGAGQSRSVAVAAAVLCVVESIDFEDALDRCKMGDISPQPTLENYAQRYAN